MSKFNLAIISIFAMIFLLVTSSCVTKEVEVTETYYETAYKQEPYKDTEQYEITTPHATNLLSAKTTFPFSIQFNTGEQFAVEQRNK